MERDTPSLEPLQPYLEVPVDEPAPGCPTQPHKRDSRPQSLPFITLGVPYKGAPPPSRFPSQSSHGERHSISRALSAISRSTGR